MYSNKVGISAENVDAPKESIGNVGGGIHTENNDQSSVFSKNNSDQRKTAKQRRFRKDTIIYGIPVKNAARLDQS